MFTVDNTPKNSSYLKKGLNKLRSSTRKSPGSRNSKKSPNQTSARKENKPLVHSRVAAVRAGRAGSLKSPQVGTTGLKKSPQTTSRSAKSPRLATSARKVITEK